MTINKMNKICGFFGPYRFLSNFWPSEVSYSGIKFPTVEHAYQFAKLGARMQFDGQELQRYIKSSPSEAKKFGNKCELRKDWEQVKLDIMEELVRQKFQIPKLRQQLIDTGESYLEETNTWGDRFWGVSYGVGENHLGKLLMKIRSELRANIS